MSRDHEFFWINLFGEFRKNCCRIVQSANMMRVSDKVERGGFRGGNKNRPARRIERLNRNFRDLFAHYEDNTNRSTLNWPAVHRKTDLKFLRTMMGRSVVLRRRQKTCVVGQAKTLHQIRNELISRKASERLVFRRNNNVEAAGRRSDHLLFTKAINCEFGGGRRNA